MTPTSDYRKTTLMESVLPHLRIGNGCWEWAGPKWKLGYGRVRHDGACVGAHRIVYELFVRKIPEGLEIDHLCRNPKCVRPDHLEPVTHAENMRRSAVYKQWTHCAKGHALCGYNLAPANKGKFRCRICKNSRTSLDAKNKKIKGKCKCGGILEGGYKSCSRCRQRAIDYWHKNNQPVPAKERA